MEIEIIQNKIYEIRNQRVMLDFDLAELQDTETKCLKEAIRQNIERFEGTDFILKLSGDEVAELSGTQIATLNKGIGLNVILQFQLIDLQHQSQPQLHSL